METRFPMNRPIAFVMAVFHLGAVIALFFPTWLHLLLFLVVWRVGAVSITLCYHRLLTHRGFKTPLWFEYFLTTLATLTLQGDPIKWVAIHRIHHTHTEVPGDDPHTPLDGRWWSHMDWMLFPNPVFLDRALLRKKAQDLYKHKYYRWLEKFFWLPVTIWGFTCLYFGGVPAVLWGHFLPVVVNLHSTWLVNSATHMWGKQRFNTGDHSRNNWWVAILTAGEGWHNNHHKHPVSARHGLAWYEVDETWYYLKFLKFIGLVSDMKEAKLP